jgi:iron complex outermembrane receptor protein
MPRVQVAHADAHARICRALAATLLAWIAAPAGAAGSGASPVLETVVIEDTPVTVAPPATRTRIPWTTLRRATARTSAAESLVRVPGVAVAERNNEAQDTRLGVRGFGARSNFGVRGVRLVLNGIPLTAADGQGQLQSVLPAHIDRVDVTRGPFAALAGNAAGGVFEFTADPAVRSPGSGVLGTTSPDAWRIGADARGTSGRVGWIAGASHVHTDGFRPHSAARRSVLDAIVRAELSPGTTLDLVANAMDLPLAQDPLGLTPAEFTTDPDSVAPTALLFDTRKVARQAQLGASLTRGDRDAGLRASAYGATRDVEQFLAIPVVAQVGPLHPGGVIDLGRNTGGVALRGWRRSHVGNAVVDGALGLELDTARDDRQGYGNYIGTTLGQRGALRRDERNDVDAAGLWARVDIGSGAWTTSLAARASRIEFESDDRYVTATNPDDSGSRSFDATTPVAGLRWSPDQRIELHAAAGRGFETPTANELAYQPDGTAGPNTGLDPARSRQADVGLLWRPSAGHRIDAIAFRVRTEDEIVVADSSGGRTTFRNAGRTARDGVELGWQARISDSVDASIAFTWIDARYDEAFATSAGTVPGGSRLPGVPSRYGFADLRWQPGRDLRFGVEVRFADDVASDDFGRLRAPGWGSVDLHASRRWRMRGGWIEGFARLVNAGDKRYAGSVIVNAGARYLEPAPGRTLLVGAEWRWRE